MDTHGHHSGAPASPLRILVVDDHPIVRKGLVDLLNDEPGFVVCGEAASPTEALSMAAAQRPDVAIVDLSLGSESGLDLVERLSATNPDLRSLVLSSYDERLYAARALRAGALGYIMKARPASELLDAVRRVAAGKSYLSEETAEQILSTMAGHKPPAGAPPLRQLSNRERQVLVLMGRGRTTREIAGDLRVSVKTVETHYARLKEKLGARNARELMRLAVNLTDRGI